MLAAYLYRRLSGVLWGLAFASKINILGLLLLRDRRSVVPVFVGLSLAFVAAHGVETDGMFLYSLNYNGWLVSYHSRKNPLTGWTALFFEAAWYAYYTEFL